MTPPAGALSSEAGVLLALAQLDQELGARLPPGVPHAPAAEARLAAGLPALLGEPLLEGQTLRAALHTAASVLRASHSGSSIRRAAELLADDEALGPVLAIAAVAGDWETIGAAAVRRELDPDAAVVLLDYAVRPWLRLAAQSVQSLVIRSGWQAGHCPACGGPPLLAELRGPERVRVLRCGRCASAWEFPRLACHACGERTHDRLSYLHGEGQAEFRRADVCETCRSYLKAIAVLDPLTATALVQTDLATAALDFAALERGYRRAHPPQF